jgi:hypothetical protein
VTRLGEFSFFNWLFTLVNVYWKICRSSQKSSGNYFPQKKVVYYFGKNGLGYVHFRRFVFTNSSGHPC